MQTITTNVYTIDELDEKAKEKAIEWYSSTGLDYDWWSPTYEDAENIGLRITSFDLDRNRHAKGEFMVLGGAEQVAGLIMKEHGEMCETHKTATQFIKERAELEKERESYEKKDEIEAFDDRVGLLEEEFLQSLLEDYSIMLHNEYEYLQSEESIAENIRMNEYTFTIDGKRFA